MSSTTKCPHCKKTPQQPINLRCQHHPCYECSQSLMALESQTPVQTKYKIICPACNKKTVFYDLRHLILTHTSNQDQQLFVTDKYLTQKPEVRLQTNRAPVQNNYFSLEQSSQPITRRGSIQSIANSTNKLLVDVKCLQHSEPYRYFCCDCSDNINKNCLLCCECAKPHYKGGHKLLSLLQSESRLLSFNLRSKEQMKSKHNEILSLMDYLKHHKNILQDHFLKLQENLSSEFNSIFTSLQNRYNSLRATLQAQYQQQLQSITEKMDKLTCQQKTIQQLTLIELKDLQNNSKFYQNYQKIKTFTVQKQIWEINIKQLPQIHKKWNALEKINQEWISIGTLGSFETEMTHNQQKKTKKQINLEEQYSHRSIQQKENIKIMGVHNESKASTRKLLA